MFDRSSEPERTYRSPSPGQGEVWHSLELPRLLSRLDASSEGLTEAEAEHRLQKYGPNRLAAPTRVSWWDMLVDQFRSVVILLLVVATVVAALLGDGVQAVAILAVLVINAGIGFTVEWKGRRAMEALLQHETAEATVLRGGTSHRIPADRLVPGDVMEVREGEAVPADARLLAAEGVRTSEAALTGESAPVDKSIAPVPEGTLLADRACMLYSGTAVSVGTARGLVVATGMGTELGRIGRLLEGIDEERTPLERRLDDLGRRLVWFALGFAGIVSLAGMVRGLDAVRMLETGVALAIAAVPEGLPAVATIALAIGLRRMARRRALVRHLSAVEALGSTTVVCTDKTGTLTAGEMTATTVVTATSEVAVTGSGYVEGGELTGVGEDASGQDPTEAGPALEALLRAAALTQRIRVEPDGTLRGDPTDAALLVLARKGDYSAEDLLGGMPRVGEIPFSSELRLSASIHRVEGRNTTFVKGAPDAILERCGRVSGAEGSTVMSDELLGRLQARNETMAAEGLRVIALAEGVSPEATDTLPEELVFLGLVGMLDPPAAGVAETIQELRDAGIRVVMITGDQPATAAAVAGSLGIPGSDRPPLDGHDLAAMDDQALQEAVGQVAVYGRTSPDDKLRIVSALRARGEIAAMIGDGVNDAAALKRADVGVAMGIRGTAVAKEVADLILQDDQFPTIGAAVEEGRVIYDNIRKFVYYLFGCNVAELMVVTIATLAGLPLPLLPLQILWLNLVTDTFPALALAIEPGEPDTMRRPPRAVGEPILSRAFVTSLGIFAVLITAATMAAFIWALETGPEERAVTMAFVTLALAQLFHLGTARSRTPVLRPHRALANRWALGAVALVVGLQFLAVHWPPLAVPLETTPLSLRDWLVALGLAAIPAIVGQAFRTLHHPIRRVDDEFSAPGDPQPA